MTRADADYATLFDVCRASALFAMLLSPLLFFLFSIFFSGCPHIVHIVFSFFVFCLL